MYGYYYVGNVRVNWGGLRVFIFVMVDCWNYWMLDVMDIEMVLDLR